MPKDSAYTLCIKKLARREHAQSELNQVLEKAGFDKTVIEACLAKLVDENYQSDERFAEMLCATRIRQRYGKKKIAYELAQKDISAVTIAEQLGKHDQDWLNNAVYLIEKKLPKDKVTATLEKQKNKITRFLIGKGYAYETITAAFKALSEQYEQ